MNNELFFIFNELQTAVSLHEYAYEVISIDEFYNIIKYDELFDSKTSDLLKRSQQTFVLMRSYL